MALSHVIEHGLPEALAIRTVDRAVEGYRRRFARFRPRFDWRDTGQGAFSLEARGLRVEGRVAVAEGRIALDVELPLLLRPLRHQALGFFDREVRAWVRRAERGELEAGERGEGPGADAPGPPRLSSR